MKTTLASIACLALLVAPGCSSTRYGDPEAVETVNIDWGSTDVQTMSKKMVQSLLEAPQLAYLANPAKGTDQRIVIYMGGVRNETSEHVNTTAITDAIRTELFHSGKFRFVADQPGQEEIGEQVRFQQESGRVDPAQAKRFGKQLGAEVILYGTLRSIEKHRPRSLESAGVKKEDVWYQFVFTCENIESGELIWTDDAEIRKEQSTGPFGAR